MRTGRLCAGLLLTGLLYHSTLPASQQMYEPLSASVRAVMQRSVADMAAPRAVFSSEQQGQRWLNEMSQRLKRYISDEKYRIDFLKTVHYEASRAGLQPELVLSVIQVESAFRKYAVSSAGARGYMQIMPFWVDEIGTDEHNLFHLRVNLRYGCTILRHYLDIEKGNLFRALGRYNGSLGKARYPDLVRNAWNKNWLYQPAEPVEKIAKISRSD